MNRRKMDLKEDLANDLNDLLIALADRKLEKPECMTLQDINCLLVVLEELKSRLAK